MSIIIPTGAKTSFVPPMGDLTEGSLIATWINCCLWMLEIVFLYQYLRTVWERRLFLKCFVILSSALSSVSLIVSLSAVYITLVQADCDASLKKLTTLFTFDAILVAVTSFIVQQFLIYRFWRLSKQSLLSVFLSLLLSAAVGFLSEHIFLPL
jgi:glucan phosphoethanolaminetransferase (alkaline phosphatase superfamily)